MAPLPPNSTARLKVFYQNAEAEHTLIIRIASIANAPGAEGNLQAILGDIGAAFSFSEITAVQISDALSDIFLDYAATTLIGDNWGADPATEETNATGLTFIGRTAGGRRAKFTLFGYKNPLSEFRLLASESVGIADAVAVLDTATASFLAIDGLEPVWKNYADIKANDHWVKEARNG